MYLPKSKYDPPKYSKGESLVRANGKAYVGWYFRTFEDKYYTGKEPLPTSEELYNEFHGDEEETVTFSADRDIAPTEMDRSREFFTRFFLQDKRTNRIIEVKKEKYLALVKKDYIRGTELVWNLSHPVEDQIINGYKFEGSATRNQKTVDRADDVLKGIKNSIKDYKKFA